MREGALASSSARMTTALLTVTTLDSLSSIVTLTVALAMASSVRLVKAAVSPVIVVSKRSSGCSESLWSYWISGAVGLEGRSRTDAWIPILR